MYGNCGSMTECCIGISGTILCVGIVCPSRTSQCIVLNWLKYLSKVY